MKAKVFVREITQEERQALEAQVRSADPLVMRRSQIVLLSAEGKSIREITRLVGYGRETVRMVIRRFNEKGLAVLQRGSRRPRRIERAYSEENAARLKELVRRSPREFGKATSRWTLALLAEVSYEEGLTKKRVSIETVRKTLHGLGIRWKQAKRWMTSPDPHYTHKKSASPGSRKR